MILKLLLRFCDSRYIVRVREDVSDVINSTEIHVVHSKKKNIRTYGG